MFHFYTSLKQKITMLETWFHFYAILKQKITMLETWFHFYSSLKPKGKLCLRRSISFFNELHIEQELFSWKTDMMVRTQHDGQVLFHFLTSLTQNGNFAQEWFHFYASLKPKCKLCQRRSISFFNELDIEWELFSWKTDMMVRT